MAGVLRGREQGRRWVAIALEQEKGLLEAMKPLADFRGGRTQKFPSSQSILDWIPSAIDQGIRSICLVGQAIPWFVQEKLQLTLAFSVSRIPFSSFQHVRSYAERIASMERMKHKQERIAWIIHRFQRSDFAESYKDQMVRTLQGEQFEVLVDEQIKTNTIPSIVIILAHGTAFDGATKNFGIPVGLSQKDWSHLTSACESGAFIAHLGCNGAGVQIGGRHADILERMNYPFKPPRPKVDSLSPFVLRCQMDGASGILAHVDTTWLSSWGDPPAPILHWIGWLAKGTGTLGWASRSFQEAALERGPLMPNIKNLGKPILGKKILEFYDLSGFVTFGDPVVRLDTL